MTENTMIMKRLTRSFLRLMACGLAAVLVFAAAGPASAFATEVDPNYTPPPVYTSGDYSYYFNEDGETLTIEDYHGKDKDIVIPTEIDGYAVTGIGMQAFSYVKMDSLTVPEQIASIGYRAFEYCVVSESFVLPKNIRIGMNAFAYASLPDVILIPEGAQLEKCAFSYCRTGETVVVSPQAVIGKRCFGYSDRLTTVVCADGATVEEDAFEYCRALKQVILCGDVAVDEDAFSYCRSAKITQAAKDEFSRILAELAIELPEPAPRQEAGPQAESKGKTHTGIL